MMASFNDWTTLEIVLVFKALWGFLEFILDLGGGDTPRTPQIGRPLHQFLKNLF